MATTVEVDEVEVKVGRMCLRLIMIKWKKLGVSETTRSDPTCSAFER